jgi:GTP cyclohydrolase IB
MSRFLELLHALDEPVSVDSLRATMARMLARLEATSGFIELRFPYFVTKRAPVSGVESLMDYRVTLTAEAGDSGQRCTIAVVVPVTSLCPCSKNISDYGAHNQRSHVTIEVEVDRDLAIETLIAVAEQAASCELWGILKRPDEKFVTERAYDNPKFVEDLVRDVAIGVGALEGVVRYVVDSENFESIHNHSAYARISGDGRAR